MRKVKQELNMTNEQIASLSGIPIKTINKITSGETKNPSWNTMTTIAEALNVPLDMFTENGSKRLVRQEELARLQKYRALESRRKRNVDIFIDQQYRESMHEWENLKDKRNRKAIVDMLYAMDPRKVDKIVEYIKTL